ncbi:hypothetical protein [Phenylobacterium sp.]|uniref:hypothetical protein n=1 Tax=Phenylobacterium sp. TaxID=1871053 RepID=UPI00286CFA4D|nr:hypothetical protein [Phenylobacterium sp.]
MPHRLRLSLAAAALVLVLAAPALAANKVVDATKAFGHLDAYLKLPAAERSHFTMAFYLHLGSRPLTAPVWLVEGERKTPIPLRADGKVLRLPTLAQLGAAKVEVGVDAATRLGASIGLEPLVAPSTDMDARELAAAVAQAARGAKQIAGVMAFAVPTPTSVVFVGATVGEVEFADGKRAALPLIKGAAAYAPASLPNALRIRFARPPLKLDID